MSDAPRQQLPPKKEVALALLEGPSLFIHLDPRKPAVLVPKWFTGQPQLVLQVGLNMAIPIPDLKVDDDGVSCTLSFNRAPFFCRLPWTAVYALVGEDGRGMIWQDDVPPEVAVQMQKTTQPTQPKQASKKPRAKLSAVASDDETRAKTKEKRSDGERVGSRPRLAPADVEPPSGQERVGEDSPREERRERPAKLERDLRPTQADGARARTDETDDPPDEAPKKPKRELPPYLRVIK